MNTALNSLILSEHNVLAIDYIKKICSKCKGTEQQKKRDCILLKGFSLPSCMHMDRAIDKRKSMKKLHQEWADELFNDVNDWRESR